MKKLLPFDGNKIKATPAFKSGFFSAQNFLILIHYGSSNDRDIYFIGQPLCSRRDLSIRYLFHWIASLQQT
jgi:hypothetical protein